VKTPGYLLLEELVHWGAKAGDGGKNPGGSSYRGEGFSHWKIQKEHNAAATAVHNNIGSLFQKVVRLKVYRQDAASRMGLMEEDLNKESRVEDRRETIYKKKRGRRAGRQYEGLNSRLVKKLATTREVEVRVNQKKVGESSRDQLFTKCKRKCLRGSGDGRGDRKKTGQGLETSSQLAMQFEGGGEGNN